MNSLNSFIVQSFATATLVGQALLVSAIILFLVYKVFKKKNLATSTAFISSNFLIFSFFIALFATGGSLLFSEVAHFTPCKLCWYQRIFMYPQVILFGLAMWKNDSKIRIYTLTLSVIGGLIALYHVGLQWYPAVFLPCSDETANCAIKQFAVYGYITIPVMSLTAFLLLIFLGLAAKRR